MKMTRILLYFMVELANPISLCIYSLVYKYEVLYGSIFN